MWETWVRSLGWEDSLEKDMATHSSILAWRIPWTEEPGGLQSTGSQRVGNNWAISLSTAFHYIHFLLRGMCIAVFLRNNFKLLCKQSFKYKTQMICSLLPSEEFQLLELFAYMASIKFSLGVKITSWVHLVVQWWRDWLPLQGTCVRSLVQEYPTCCGVTKFVLHTTEPAPRADAPQPRSHHSEKSTHHS